MNKVMCLKCEYLKKPDVNYYSCSNNKRPFSDTRLVISKKHPDLKNWGCEYGKEVK